MSKQLPTNLYLSWPDNLKSKFAKKWWATPDEVRTVKVSLVGTDRFVYYDPERAITEIEKYPNWYQLAEINECRKPKEDDL